MHIEPKMGGCSVVLIGSFNPAIFSPAWFAMHDIVATAQAENAEQVFIVPDYARFKLGSDTISVDPNRFSVERFEAPWIAACDLVTKTFGDFLSHTPVNQVGINRHVHFDVRDEGVRNEMGRALAPVAAWGEWGKQIEESPPDLRSGFITLSMQESWREENFFGHFQARVEPSTAIRGNTGIFVQVNHHCQKVHNESQGAFDIVTFLASRFEKSIKHSEWIIDQVMALSERVKQ